MHNTADKIARLSVSLNKPHHDALKRLADENDVSIAWIVRKAIERLLDSNPQQDLFRSNEVREVARK
jgi:predicted transcriptional regulator